MLEYKKSLRFSKKCCWYFKMEVMIKINETIHFIIHHPIESEHVATEILLKSTIEEDVLLDSRRGRFIPKRKVSLHMYKNVSQARSSQEDLNNII